MKWESERSIINSLHDRDRSFTDLVESTDLSRSVLSQRLKELEKKGKIETVPEMKTKRFLYHLNHENLDTIDELFIKTHILSQIFILSLVKSAEDPSISDEEYANRLGDGLIMLLMLRFESYRVTPIDIREGWIKNTMGLEFVRNISQLYPETRNILKYTTKNISPKELAILDTEDQKEAANLELKRLNSIIERIAQKLNTQ